MGRYSYLLKNVGLLALSSFATKLLTFFMVPLYTSVLTTGEYGTYDLFSTTVSVLLPLLTLNIQEGVLRYALDKNFNRDAVVTVGIRWTLFGSIVVGVGAFFFFGLGVFDVPRRFAVYFFLMFVTQALCCLVPYYVRGIDRIADLSVAGVISSAVTISLNLFFLLSLNWGLDGYFLANIIGPLIQVAYLLVRTGMLRHYRPFALFPEQNRVLILYSVPLIANSIAWWISSVSDRYIVVFFCGVAANGIYSVASKIPSILSVFQGIFSQAWTLSAVKDYDREDGDGFFATTYEAYNCVLTLVCGAIILFDKLLARFLYANDFYEAWQYVPWLTIAVAFGALSNYLGGFFTAVKDTKMFAQSSVAGAATNLALNFVLVPLIGPMGAAVSTTICYVEVWAIRFWHSRKYIKLRIPLKRDIAAYLFLVAQSVLINAIADQKIMYLMVSIVYIVICFLYRGELNRIVRKAISKQNVIQE